MKDLFEIASATVTGLNHETAGKNNQDAYSLIATKELITAVVCDGCGSSPFSEFGARFGARRIARIIHNVCANYVAFQSYRLSSGIWRENLARIHSWTLQNLRKLAEETAEIVPKPPDYKGYGENIINWRRSILDCFLFTVVGVIVTPFDTLIFSLGDGTYAVNGAIRQLGPFEQNAPPYLAYNLLGSEIKIESPYSRFELQEFMATEDVESILIGTDGVVDFMAAGERCLPGREEIVGPLRQFWEDDRFFKNPDMLRRRLAMVNKTSLKPDWNEKKMVRTSGLLPDDTTLVVLRRKK